jgi:hypothetical protein
MQIGENEIYRLNYSLVIGIELQFSTDIGEFNGAMNIASMKFKLLYYGLYLQ